MTKDQEKEVIRVHGENYDYEDIPTYIREKDEKGKREKSKCCNDDMLSSGQCLNCGAEGR